MFTPFIESREFVDGKLKVTIVFTDGQSKVVEPKEFATGSQLNSYIRARREQLEATAAYEKSLALGEFTVTEDPTPTQAETDAQDWLRDFSRLERVQKLIDLGVATGTETPIVNLRNKVRDGFKPAYLALL